MGIMTIMDSHNHLALAFGILGNFISLMVYLAPLPTFYRIYKRKSTEGFQSLPYLVALFSSMLWLYYAIVKKDADLLLTINSLGCVIESIYIVTYISYATRDARILTVKLFMAMNVSSFVLIFLTTQFVIHDPLRVHVLGWICTSFAVCVFAAPLTIMAQVIRTESVEFMPFYLSLFLTLSAIVWFGYGLSLKDIHVAIPNVLGFTLGLLQMVLYAIYKNGEAKNTAVIMEEHALETMINVVVMNPLGTTCDQVYPIIPVKDHENEQGRECAEEKEKSFEGSA